MLIHVNEEGVVDVNFGILPSIARVKNIAQLQKTATKDCGAIHLVI